MCGIGTALMNTPAPPSIGVLRMMVATTKVTARVSSANSSPRSRFMRNTTAPMATPSSAAIAAAIGTVGRNGTLRLRRQSGRRVHADAEEGGMAQAEIARKAREQRPARRQRDPEEDEIEERIVEGRQARPSAGSRKPRCPGPRRPWELCARLVMTTPDPTAGWRSAPRRIRPVPRRGSGPPWPSTRWRRSAGRRTARPAGCRAGR